MNNSMEKTWSILCRNRGGRARGRGRGGGKRQDPEPGQDTDTDVVWEPEHTKHSFVPLEQNNFGDSEALAATAATTATNYDLRNFRSSSAGHLTTYHLLILITSPLLHLLLPL